jgi:exodeoxyribonuclease VIII
MDLITPEPGSYPNLSAPTYFAWNAASNSSLRELGSKSPAHCKVKQEIGIDSEALRFGSLFHCKMLEPELFASTYVAAPKLDRRTKEGKAQYLELCEEFGEENLIDARTFKELELSRESVLKNPTARKLVESLIMREHSIAFIDEKSGALCKARLDGVTKQGIIVDFKTTQSAARSDFARSVFNYGYHSQGAHYLRAARSIDINSTHFVIIAVEKGTGFVALYDLDAPTIQAGENQLDQWLPIWKRCSDSGIWPGYPEEIQTLNVPEWAINKINQNTKGE